jgi:imidazolonepropionase
MAAGRWGIFLPDLVVVNAGQLVTCDGKGDEAERKLGIVEDGAIVVEKGKVAWVGTTKELRRSTFGKSGRTVDANGGLVTPGFVDPHTHLVFAGSREDELERKISGETYTEILQSGGGILRTVRETRRASVSQIASESQERLGQLLSNGVTTAEVKTGYGLDLRQELKLLSAIRRVQSRSPVGVVSTFLGLHAKPEGFETSKEFASYAIKEMLPPVAKMKSPPRFSDCFCEDGVFSKDDCRRYLRASLALGFRGKIHADEFSDSGGASLAAEMGCVSADHLGKSNSLGIRSMARKKVTAVLLPGTSLYSSIPFADARSILKAGCQVALGTDLSPNSWVESPQFVMSLACIGMRMTPAQALLGFTAYAASAIDREDIGRLAVGSSADFVVHNVPSYKFLPYRLGGKYVRSVFRRGRLVYSAKEN